MLKLLASSSIREFYYEVYNKLKQIPCNVLEAWFEINDIIFLKRLTKYEILDFISNFNFLELKKGHYKQDYIVIDRLQFVMDCVKFIKFDLKIVSELLDFNGFEILVKEILVKNNYKVINNFRFSDHTYYRKKTSQKRYEIDVIGIHSNKLLIIDAKQWKRRDCFSSINKAANLQLQRIIALKKNPDAFSQLIHELLGKDPKIKTLPFILLPIMVTLEESGNKLNDNQIPIVSIYNLNAFLQELSRYFHYYKSVKINKINIQKMLKTYF
jgi:hypothetical protein